MKKNVARKWINALRSGKYKKTTGALKRTDGSYCALGVLCDLYKRDGKPLGEKTSKNPEDEFYDAVRIGGEVQMPPKKVLNWAGLGQIQAEDIASLNDFGDSFKRIATFIEQNKEIL